ncbi:hypothetical protein EUX98_g8542 [Antrodiella citrinella]|uniref:Uncharacterized protein n=1 Tax=Antrodiella citrinella TaxID=2447956 RepID=A0A4S4M639_9APHY|nr:hypothetical protein EUX98_g8542 [Antrodiella citrinella]
MSQRVKLMVAKCWDDDKKMNVDGEGSDIVLPPGVSSDVPLPSSVPTPEPPGTAATYSSADLRDAFTHLQETTRQMSPFATHMLNPYITIFFKFLTTILKDRHALGVVERDIYWEQIAAFLNVRMSRRLLARERERERNDPGSCC